MNPIFDEANKQDPDEGGIETGDIIFLVVTLVVIAGILAVALLAFPPNPDMVQP